MAQTRPKRTKLYIFGSPVSHAAAPTVANQVFEALNMAPHYYYDRIECPTLKTPDAPYFEIMKRPDTLGACCTMPLKLEVVPHMASVDKDATAVGSVNTISLGGEIDGQAQWQGTNNDWVGCLYPVLSALTDTSSPFPADSPRAFAPNSAAGFLIGAGGAIRGAAYALHQLNVSPLYVVNRDPHEVDALIAHNNNAFNVVSLPLNVDETMRILSAERKPIAIAIGAIPSALPQSEAEQAVYAIAAIVFARSYDVPSAPTDSTYLPLPSRPILEDMPFVTRLRSLAETQNWTTIPGTEVSAEIVFHQIKLWTDIDVPVEVREQARQSLRASAAAAYAG